MSILEEIKKYPVLGLIPVAALLWIYGSRHIEYIYPVPYPAPPFPERGIIR